MQNQLHTDQLKAKEEPQKHRKHNGKTYRQMVIGNLEGTPEEIAHQKREKLILFISFIAGLMFAIVELIYSISSHSQSVLMDAVYDATELIFIALILFLTPLFYKPVSEKHPYGFYQIESIFIIIKGFMMLSVTLGVITQIIESAIAGGNPVNEMGISIFQLILGLISVVIYLVMKKLDKPLSSPTVSAELLGWKLDINYSLGLSLAFFGGALLTHTPLSFIAPYFDQIVAVIVMLFMLPENIKMLWTAIKDVFLFSPDEEVVNEIKDICSNVMNTKAFEPVFYDVTKTGRHLWIAVYFKTTQESIAVEDYREINQLVNDEIGKSFENCTCELILTP